MRFRRGPLYAHGLCMNKAFQILAAVTIASTGGAIARSVAQTSSAGDLGPRTPAIRPPVTGPAIAGNWSGTVLQIQRSIEYAVTLEITARGVQITYPELHCGGRLSRIGASRDYAFFVEMITGEPVDDDGRCSSGTITMARVGDNLAWGWFGLVKGEVVTAYGMLIRKSDANANPKVPAAEEGRLTTGTPAPMPPAGRKQRLPVKPLVPRPEW